MNDSDRFSFHVSIVRNNQQKTLSDCRAEESRDRLAAIEACPVDDGAPDPDDVEISELQRRLAREDSVESLVLPDSMRPSMDDDSRSSIWGLLASGCGASDATETHSANGCYQLLLRSDSQETSSSGRRSPHSDIDAGFSPQFHLPFPRRHIDAASPDAVETEEESPFSDRRLLGGITVLKRRNSCVTDEGALLQFPSLSGPQSGAAATPGAVEPTPLVATEAAASSGAATADEEDMRMVQERIAAEVATVLGEDDAAEALEALLSLDDSHAPPSAPESDAQQPSASELGGMERDWSFNESTTPEETRPRSQRRRFAPLPPPWACNEPEKAESDTATIAQDEVAECHAPAPGFSVSHTSRCGPVKRLLSPNSAMTSPTAAPVSTMGGVSFQMLLPRAARALDVHRDEWSASGHLDMDDQRERRRREVEDEHQRMCASLVAAAAVPQKERGAALRMLLAEAARLHDRAFQRLHALAERALQSEEADGAAARSASAGSCASTASARSAVSAASFLLTPPSAWVSILEHAERDMHCCGFQMVQRTLSCMSIFSTRGGATREYGENEYERRRRQEGRMEILTQLRTENRLFLDDATCAAAVHRHNNPILVAAQAALQRVEWDEAADRREGLDAEFDAWELMLRRERIALGELTTSGHATNDDDEDATLWGPSQVFSPSNFAVRDEAVAFPSSIPTSNDGADADAPTTVVTVDPQ